MIISTEAVSDDYLHVNACGVQYITEKNAGSYRKMGRIDYHILYIAQGRCHANIGGADTIVDAGNLILFLPGEKQEYYYNAVDKSVSCFLHFAGTGCMELLDGIFAGRSVVYIGKNPEIKTLFEKIEMELILKNQCYEKLCSAYLFQFFYIAERELTLLAQNIDSREKHGMDNVCLYMCRQYAQTLPLKAYADYCGLSLSRFSHLFKSTIGITPLEYLTKIRITKAKDYLLATNLSVSEIAEALGFSNQNYFCRIFKKNTGLSPTQYIKKHRE